MRTKFSFLIVSALILCGFSARAAETDSWGVFSAGAPCTITGGSTYDFKTDRGNGRFTTSGTLYFGGLSIVAKGWDLTVSSYDEEKYAFKGWYTMSNDMDECPGVDKVDAQLTTNVKITKEQITGSAKTCQQNVAGSKNVYHVVAPKFVPLYTITTEVSPTGAGTVTETKKYEKGTAVTLIASANAGYVIDYWKKDGVKVMDSDGKSSLSITVTADATYQVVLSSLKYDLTICPNGGTYNGKENNQKLENVLIYGTKDYNAIGVATRTGYTFGGWYSSSSGGVMIYDVGGNNKKCNDIWTADHPSGTFCGTKNVSVYAIWSAKTSVVTFDQQGGSGGSGSVTMTYDKALPKITVPTRTGYTFDGYFSKDGTQYYDKVGNGSKPTWDSEEESLTLSAKWTPLKYDLTIYPNNGSYKDSSSVQTIRDALVYETANNNSIGVATRAGYTFLGWFSASSGGNMIYDTNGLNKKCNNIWTADHPEGTFCGSEQVSVYAHWSAKTSMVTLDRQTGVGGSTSIEAIHDKTLPKIDVPTRVGYEFGGYYAEKNGGGKQYYQANGTSSITWICAEDSPQVLYAKWTAAKYTVTFFENGEVETHGQDQLTVTFDAEPVGVKVPKKTACTFNGYFYDGSTCFWDSSGAWKGGVWTIPSNVTVVAQYTSNGYIVRFDANGGKGAYADLNVTYQEEFELPDGSAFSREKFSFVGWVLSKDSEYPIYSGKDKVENHSSLAQTGTLTYYAYWKNRARLVRFDPGPEPSKVTMSTNQLEKLTGDVYGELPTATWEGNRRDFDGWWDGEVLVAPTSVVPEKSSITLQAHWLTNSYFVGFNGHGATNAAMPVQEFKFDRPQNLPPNQYEREGYEFLGWATNAEEVAKVDYEDQAEVVNLLATDKNQTNFLYAVWTGNVYTVCFYANGGVGDEMLPQDFVYGVPQVLSSNTYVREGREFAGWALDPTNEVAFTDGQLVSNLTPDKDGIVMLFAKWGGGDAMTEYSVAADCDQDGADGRVALGLTTNAPGWSVETYLGQEGLSHPGKNNLYVKSAPGSEKWDPLLTSSRIKGSGTLRFSYKTSITMQMNEFYVRLQAQTVGDIRTNLQLRTDWAFCEWKVNLGDAGDCFVWCFNKLAKKTTDYICLDDIAWIPDEHESSVTVGITLRRNDGSASPWDIFYCKTCRVKEPIGSWLPPLPDLSKQKKFMGWQTASGEMVDANWIVPKVDTQLYAKWGGNDPTEADRREISQISVTADGLGFVFTNADSRWIYSLHGTNDLIAPMALWPEVWKTNGSGTITIDLPRPVDNPSMFYYLETKGK